MREAPDGWMCRKPRTLTERTTKGQGLQEGALQAEIKQWTQQSPSEFDNVENPISEGF